MQKIQLIILCLFGGFTSYSQVTYVNLNAIGNNDGSSWENAYTDLRIALENTYLATQKVQIGF